MKIKDAVLAVKTGKKEDFPRLELPEFAFLGRSNVGKSSLINALLNRKALAKTSSTPGKTRAIYFYRVNDVLHLVDLPGYGYARVSKTLRESWGELIETYLNGREQLRACIHIVDIRHPPTENDRLMTEWLQYHRVPFVVAATKADKISRGRYQAHLNTILDTLDLGPDTPVIPFSATTKAGRDRIWAYIREQI